MSTQELIGTASALLADDHTLARCAHVTEKTLRIVVAQLHAQGNLDTFRFVESPEETLGVLQAALREETEQRMTPAFAKSSTSSHHPEERLGSSHPAADCHVPEGEG